MSDPQGAVDASPSSGLVARWLPHIPIIVGLALVGIPTLARLAKQVWTLEIGAHGPIVLATGVWILWRAWPKVEPAPNGGRTALSVLGFAVSLAIYVFGRAYDFISLEAFGVYGFGIAYLYGRFGLAEILKIWFPLFYLGFLLPLPGWVIDQGTAPLKQLVSYMATSIVEPFGIPIYREGVTLVVGPYQLLVEDACSGLNSMVGLVAISLFYIYLLRSASWKYSLFLAALLIPVAIVANALRIVILILLTYFFGDAVGQGFLHVTAGLFLFAVALLLMFGIDNLLSNLKFMKRRIAA
ncbi:MAG: exosortase V [Alphaproteobacteria bacterium]|nr:exosortase V [Alphaproteobacteria bacterium]MBU1512946.1 exosortase V [Alphaproteobacteria bacterium]MBU2094880.1 exosortase V [Alphaproteobacteria bacterium]MBU2152786.1 exosortase V [Alphaproteobacteria bacterium]MBU2306305.1 exosortase V [Alphaproteobacteria bacterium]